MELPDDIKQEIKNSFYIPLKNTDFRLSIVKPESMHLTLKFLGECDKSTIDNIANDLRTHLSVYPLIHLSLGEKGYFGPRFNPRVLCLSLEGDIDKLKIVSEQIDDITSNYGFEKEKREFKPHITMARNKSRDKSIKLIEYFDTLSIPHLTFTTLSIYIKKSELKPSGAVHTNIYEIPLSKRD